MKERWSECLHGDHLLWVNPDHDRGLSDPSLTQGLPDSSPRASSQVWHFSLSLHEATELQLRLASVASTPADAFTSNTGLTSSLSLSETWSQNTFPCSLFVAFPRCIYLHFLLMWIAEPALTPRVVSKNTVLTSVSQDRS